MAKKNNWGGAEKYGVGVLAGCLHEKLTNNIISLVGSAERLLEYVKESNPEAAKIFEGSIKKAAQELLSND